MQKKNGRSYDILKVERGDRSARTGAASITSKFRKPIWNDYDDDDLGNDEDDDDENTEFVKSDNDDKERNKDIKSRYSRMSFIEGISLESF